MVLLPMIALAACGRSAGDERSAAEQFSANQLVAPEEFAVLPQKPLELPEDLTTLPTPTPGAVSRVDLTPEADALAALGGAPGRGGATASDVALLAATTAGGVDPDIRARLARESRIYASRNQGRILERLFGQNTENSIYRGQTLNAGAEARRLIQLGVEVPQAPPN
ncbi:MAG: DUF3035 domain-containing protein [Pseudomonadota bacterium]